MPQPLSERAALPATVLVAIVGIGVHTFNHLTVTFEDVWRLLAAPEQAGFNPGTIYHPVSAVLYGWLACVVHSGRNWGRIVISVLLVFQFVGRFFVFMGYPTIEVRAQLVAGWTLSLVIAWLLWVPKPTRAYFSRKLPATTAPAA